MSDYELGKDIAEIKERLSKLEELMESLVYGSRDQEGPAQPRLPGGNGGATGRPNG